MKIVLLALISIFSFVYPAIADDRLTTLRCQAGLITIGANKLEVAAKCGQPAGKEMIERRVPGSIKAEYVQIEVWTYNFGPNDFIHVLEIEGAQLTAIKRGARGF
ncbi:MAG: DUF2845 domain-containing protein [Syntrophobacteraceae bacterium]